MIKSEIVGYSQAFVEKRTDWTDEIFSLRLTGASLKFKAGQFTKLALLDDQGELISRAYSLVNAPLMTSDVLEFLLISNSDGKLSPRLHQLKVGDGLYVGDSAHGDLIFETIPKPSTNLWLLSTGTGIGPFLSLLDDLNFRPNCDKVVLVHGVRHQADLVYHYLIEQLIEQYEGRLVYIPIVSREIKQGALHGRIPQLIDEGQLMDAAGVNFDPEGSFVMLCGNPAMIKDTTKSLLNQGLSRFRHAVGGNIVYERYW